jgi:hypothetical protein
MVTRIAGFGAISAIDPPGKPPDPYICSIGSCVETSLLLLFVQLDRKHQTMCIDRCLWRPPLKNRPKPIKLTSTFCHFYEKILFVSLSMQTIVAGLQIDNCTSCWIVPCPSFWSAKASSHGRHRPPSIHSTCKFHPVWLMYQMEFCCIRKRK